VFIQSECLDCRSLNVFDRNNNDRTVDTLSQVAIRTTPRHHPHTPLHSQGPQTHPSLPGSHQVHEHPRLDGHVTFCTQTIISTVDSPATNSLFSFNRSHRPHQEGMSLERTHFIDGTTVLYGAA